LAGSTLAGIPSTRFPRRSAVDVELAAVGAPEVPLVEAAAGADVLRVGAEVDGAEFDESPQAAMRPSTMGPQTPPIQARRKTDRRDKVRATI
jgi:hypothetical protein